MKRVNWIGTWVVLFLLLSIQVARGVPKATHSIPVVGSNPGEKCEVVFWHCPQSLAVYACVKSLTPNFLGLLAQNGESLEVFLITLEPDSASFASNSSEALPKALADKGNGETIKFGTFDAVLIRTDNEGAAIVFLNRIVNQPHFPRASFFKLSSKSRPEEPINK